MYNTNITSARNNLYKLADRALDDSEIISISTKKGNIVMVSEDDYNSMVETLIVLQDKRTMEYIMEAKQNLDNKSYWVDESEVNWDV